MSVSQLVKELVTEGICLTDEGKNNRGALGRRPSSPSKAILESVYQGFAEENEAAGETWTSIEVSQCTYTDAAKNFALSEYFYQPGHRPKV